MGLDDRLVLFLLGCLIGSVVGYIVRLLQETREKIDLVDEHVKDFHHDPNDEAGFIRTPSKQGVALFLVVLLAFFAAISTQFTNNGLKDAQSDLAKVQTDLKQTQDELKDSQKRMAHIVLCTTSTFAQALNALNERTTYTGAQAASNVRLQKAQAKMLKILIHEPPYSEVDRDRAVQEYIAALDQFFELSKKSKQKVINNDYPTVEGFEACLDSGVPEGS